MKPDHCHPADVKWIAEQIRALPHSMHSKVLAKYSACFDETAEKHRGEIGEMGFARREANTRLRILGERYAAGGLSNVSQPATMRG